MTDYRRPLRGIVTLALAVALFLPAMGAQGAPSPGLDRGLQSLVPMRTIVLYSSTGSSPQADGSAATGEPENTVSCGATAAPVIGSHQCFAFGVLECCSFRLVAHIPLAFEGAIFMGILVALGGWGDEYRVAIECNVAGAAEVEVKVLACTPPDGPYGDVNAAWGREVRLHGEARPLRGSSIAAPLGLMGVGVPLGTWKVELISP